MCVCVCVCVCVWLCVCACMSVREGGRGDAYGSLITSLIILFSGQQQLLLMELDKKDGEKNILVFDLGGGTFDVCVPSHD